ncbi:hypothetical protein H8356DRAFT_1343503 [Neocallimastix lanati (nom. inval.)]|nr:hypothetical protein H8356DRAFT_1343503 [Neocallimastix sp. JGI-2020a]
MLKLSIPVLTSVCVLLVLSLLDPSRAENYILKKIHIALRYHDSYCKESNNVIDRSLTKELNAYWTYNKCFFTIYYERNKMIIGIIFKYIIKQIENDNLNLLFTEYNNEAKLTNKSELSEETKFLYSLEELNIVRTKSILKSRYQRIISTLLDMRHDTPRYKTSATPAHLDPFFSGNWEVNNGLKNGIEVVNTISFSQNSIHWYWYSN